MTTTEHLQRIRAKCVDQPEKIEADKRASGSLERVVRLPASNRQCPACLGGCAVIDWSIRGRERFVSCKRCGGTGRVQSRASRKPNELSSPTAEPKGDNGNQ